MNMMNASTLLPLWLTREELTRYKHALAIAVDDRGEVHAETVYGDLKELLRDINNALGE